LLRRLRLRRLRLRLRLPPPDLLPLPSRALVWAGAICVNFAISFASRVVEPHQPYEPYDAAGRLGGH
jgi:hypothetical protein